MLGRAWCDRAPVFSIALSDLSLFGRKGTLLVATQNSALDLSPFRFRFEVHQSDVLTPNGTYVRIYNLDDETVNAIFSGQGGVAEYTRIVIQAGYTHGAFGVIFDGTIKQVGRGKENNTDTFLDIWASEADVPYAFGYVAGTVGANATPKQIKDQIDSGMAQYGVSATDNSGLLGGTLPRGKVLYGLAKDYYRTLGQTTGTTITFQGGAAVAIPLTGYLPGEVVVINSQTGMVGIPEATQNGVMVTALLNPLLRIGTRIKINNADINQNLVTSPGLKAWDGMQNFASIAADGVYRIIGVDYEGDTRGNPWYCRITALAINQSAAPGNSVKEFG